MYNRPLPRSLTEVPTDIGLSIRITWESYQTIQN